MKCRRQTAVLGSAFLFSFPFAAIFISFPLCPLFSLPSFRLHCSLVVDSAGPTMAASLFLFLWLYRLLFMFDFYRIFTDFYWVWSLIAGLIEFSMEFTGFYRVLPGFTGSYRVLLGFHWVLSGFTGFLSVWLGFTGILWVLVGFTGSYWVLLGFEVFDWVWLEF